MNFNYTLVERCGCGASVSVDVYPHEAGYKQAQIFRDTHKHIEPLPPVPPRTAARGVRGRPALRGRNTSRTGTHVTPTRNNE